MLFSRGQTLTGRFGTIHTHAPGFEKSGVCQSCGITDTVVRYHSAVLTLPRDSCLYTYDGCEIMLVPLHHAQELCGGRLLKKLVIWTGMCRQPLCERAREQFMWFLSWRSRCTRGRWRRSPGVSGNRFPTSKTPAEFSIFHSSKRGLDALQLNKSPLLGGLRHRLTLKSVHSGDTSHGGLIQLDGLHSFLSGMLALKDFVTKMKQKLLEMVDVEAGRCHDL
jgi:hypothetical protein